MSDYVFVSKYIAVTCILDLNLCVSVYSFVGCLHLKFSLIF